MKIYAPAEVITVQCPVPNCRAQVGVWCGVQKVHERRLRKFNEKQDKKGEAR